MKVLFFIESLYPGGKERRLVELIKGLSKSNEIEMELVLMKENIHYTDINETGIKIHYLVRKYLKKDPSIFFKFYKITKSFKPDIIHVWGNMVAIYAIPAKLFLKIPMVNNQITSAPKQVTSSFLGHTLPFKFSDIIVANSYAGLKSFNAPKNKSKVIYNGFNFGRIDNVINKEIIREKFDIKTKFVIGMVASFTEKKDYESYLKMAKLVLKTQNDTTFLCIGSGDDSKYKAMVAQEHYDNIKFLGKQKEVENIMNICDIGVLATFTEGISNSVLEFMALKKPVVVSGEGGCSELILNNENGYLLEIGDYKKMSDLILELLNDDSKRSNFGEISNKIVKEKFNILKMTQDFNELYHKIAG